MEEFADQTGITSVQERERAFYKYTKSRKWWVLNLLRPTGFYAFTAELIRYFFDFWWCSGCVWSSKCVRFLMCYSSFFPRDSCRAHLLILPPLSPNLIYWYLDLLIRTWNTAYQTVTYIQTSHFELPEESFHVFIPTMNRPIIQMKFASLRRAKCSFVTSLPAGTRRSRPMFGPRLVTWMIPSFLQLFPIFNHSNEL